MGTRKLTEYGRWLTKKQLQDAIDRVECLGRPSARPIVKMLHDARDKCVAQNMDQQRLYVHLMSVHRGYYVKRIRLCARGKYGMERSPRNKIVMLSAKCRKTSFFIDATF